MKRGGGNSKGSSFERRICKVLSSWWTDGNRDDLFWRTASSGGRSTQRAKKGVETAGGAGDLTFTDPSAEPLLKAFAFELKRGYNSIDALDMLDKTGKPPLIADFWQQSRNSQKQSGALFPAVIFQRDRREVCLMIPPQALARLEPALGPYYSRRRLTVQWGQERIIIVRLADFLEYATPEAIQGLLVQ